MSYPPRHETTNLCAFALGRRAQVPGGRPAFARCLRPPPLPNPARKLQGRECLPDRPLFGLQPTNCPQRYPRVQRERSGGSVAKGLLQAAHYPRGLRSPERPAIAGDASSGSSGVRQTHQLVDPELGRRGELRRGPNRRASQRRDHPGDAAEVGGALGAGQTVDQEPRSGVRERKKGGATG